MQRRRDQKPFFAFDLPALAGPPPRPAGPNLTDHGPNRARMKENDPLKDSARRCAETRSARGSLPAYDLRDTGVVDARSGRNRIWIVKLLQWLKVSNFCVLMEWRGRLVCEEDDRRLAPTKFAGNLALHDDRNKSDHDGGGTAARWHGGAWRSGGGREVEEGGGGHLEARVVSSVF
ncbi:putative inactive leucine-rich repeat receptor-like protein kinase-like [Dorcoceras hygrometricum]|uniref:Putative inactive leucine-rich repeat receptor-like protein kinase-like n=1 Tax=Dorcoceras hygrometricum TaxID=472368 RepID=A0A2Z7A5I0_9LAMI|nr:putative inactive leucine-rich repeat receptor-like protein kinase-like [Dorcoceras hygrometricum]